MSSFKCYGLKIEKHLTENYSVCLHDRPRANWLKSKSLHSNHGNEDCYTNLHVQEIASAILIDFVVITLFFYVLIWAVSSVETDTNFLCDKN